MAINYPNLITTNLIEFQKKYSELSIAFNFLEQLTFELKKISLKKKSINTLIFVDYKTSQRYFVDIDQTNLILKRCYYEYYFNVILNDLNLKFDLKSIWLYDKWFDIFSKNLFIVLKSFSRRTKEKTTCNYSFFLIALQNSSVKDFNNIGDYNQYCIQLKKVYNKIDFNKLIKCYKDYFFMSYETISFSLNKSNNDYYCRFYKYFDLERYLKGKVILNDNLLAKNDKVIQLLILISFINARYIYSKKIYQDNSFIHSLIGSKDKITEFETENYIECLHFNNLLKIIGK